MEPNPNLLELSHTDLAILAVETTSHLLPAAKPGIEPADTSATQHTAPRTRPHHHLQGSNRQESNRPSRQTKGGITMGGYVYDRKAVQAWDYIAQATLYYDMAQNEARNARLWKARYESLAAKQKAGA